jgi:DNA-binding CsgD family transcriptional regulator
MPSRSVPIETVFQCCIRDTAAALRTLRRELGADTTGARLLDAVLAQCDGDTSRADRLLRGAWQTCEDEDRQYVADIWLPILLSFQRFEEADTVLADPRIDANAARFAAFRSVAAAASGDIERSRDIATLIESELADEVDGIMRARVHARLALAAFYRSESEETLRHADSAVALARRHGAHRTAAIALSVAYVTHVTLTGDTTAALRSARDIAAEAAIVGDRSVRAVGLIATYELAVELADDDAAREAREQLRAEPLPEQYLERFASRVADAMMQAANGDYPAARNVFVVLSDEAGRSAGERALCRSLASLCNVAVGDDAAARKLSRRAISSSTRPPLGLSAYELRYRRLARAIACAACLLVGDAVRADRRADAALLRDDPDVAGLVAAGRGTAAVSLSPKVRGYARLIEAVHRLVASREGTGPLTATEVQVLQQIDMGRNAPEIALAMGRSPYTIRTHVRNAVEKLHARGRLDALARARRLGLLQNP